MRKYFTFLYVGLILGVVWCLPPVFSADPSVSVPGVAENSVDPNQSFGYYTWTDSNTVTTSEITLTASNTSYTNLTIYTDTVDVWIKVNTSKTFILVSAGVPFSFGPQDQVSSITVKTRTGTGLFFTIGTKRQYSQSTVATF